jgi:hypothetical protein
METTINTENIYSNLSDAELLIARNYYTVVIGNPAAYDINSLSLITDYCHYLKAVKAEILNRNI